MQIAPDAKVLIEAIINRPPPWNYQIRVGRDACSIVNVSNGETAYGLRGAYLSWYEYEKRTQIKIGKRLAKRLINELPRATGLR